MAAPNARAMMMDRWGLPLEVPDAAIAGLLPTTREAIVSQYAGFRLKLTRQFKRSQKRGDANPLGATVCGFPIAPPASFARDLGPEEYLAVHSAYLDVLRKCLQQKRIDTAEQAADEKRAARMPDPEPSGDESDFNDDGPSASDSDDSDHGDDDAAAVIAPPPDALPHALAALPLPPAPALVAPDAMPLPPAPALVAPIAPPLAPAPVPERAAKRARVADAPAAVPRVHAPAPPPVPAPGVPAAVAAMLERLVPDRITAFVQRLERTKVKKDADPVYVLLNDLLGANHPNMASIPKLVRARFATVMAENGFDLKAVGATGMHYRSRQFPKEVIRLQRQARRPTDWGIVSWLGGVRVW